jgi:hypothetical protein
MKSHLPVTNNFYILDGVVIMKRGCGNGFNLKQVYRKPKNQSVRLKKFKKHQNHFAGATDENSELL